VQDTPSRAGTDGADYTNRLQRLGGARWKRVIDAQAPYRWNIRRLDLGRTLDVGCGIGRNLAHLDGNGVGVDHNPSSIQACRALGLEAYTIDDFLASAHARPDAFDAMLAAHVVEHLAEPDARDVIAMYLPYVRPGGRVVMITPQERGYASDATHVRFVRFEEAAALARTLDLRVERQYSFPFPRAAGKVFTYNEFVTIARKV
jgi:2-polyprenyl-3-methyl-5-hydroxy-6-metoxy-1,4-benzoquinol methylase